MHATQNQGGTSPEPSAIAESTLIGLFRIVPNGLPFLVAKPQPAAVGYTLTNKGREALAETGPVEASGTVAQVLRDAATYLERYGWIQGAYYDASSTTFTPAACLVGAIGMVCYGGPVEAPAQQFDDPGFLDFEEAILHLDRFLLVEDGSESYEFNDAKGRTVADVTRVLRAAADRPADELIDALRAIEAYNVEVAARMGALTPSGVWADTTTGGAE